MTQSIIKNDTQEQQLRMQVFAAVQEYYQFKFGSQSFIPGQTYPSSVTLG